MVWSGSSPRPSRSLPLLVVCALSVGCSAEAELDRLCEVATQVMDDAEVPPEHKASTIAKRFGPRNLKVADALERMANAPAEQRMPILREIGGESWTCPALEQALSPGLGESE